MCLPEVCFFVAAIICYCSSQILASWGNYYPLLIALVELLFYCVELSIRVVSELLGWSDLTA